MIRILAWILKLVFKCLYRVKVKGLENLQTHGENTLIIANHVSFLDPVFLTLFIPGDKSFAVHSKYAQKWYSRLAQVMATQFSMNQNDSMAMKGLIEHLQKGNRVVIFPEGRITATGSLMKIYPGTGMLAEKADAMVVPIRISGLEYTPYSYLKGLVRIRRFPPVTITILPARKLNLPDHVKPRERRHIAANQISTMMSEMMFETSPYKQRLWDALLDARATHGDNHEIIEDIERQPLTYKTMCLKAFVLSNLLKKHCEAGKHIGVLLPNTNAVAVTLFALQSIRCIPAMLNFTMGRKAAGHAIEAGNVGTVLTSRKFIAVAELESLAEFLEERVHVIYLEDVREELTLGKKLKGLFANLYARQTIARRLKGIEPSDEAVVLFTSGSEGIPKGVVLSHQNLLANVYQAMSRMKFSMQEVCLNALPMFHSFGLTGGTLLPMMQGTKVFLYPSPLHYKAIPELAYDINATIIFGTNVFLHGYAKHAHPYDFYTLKHVIAGAERVQEETYKIWFEKFGIRIMEGYGATEASPILSVNTPREFRMGSVGRLCPAIDYRLEAVTGIAKGGRLWVRGPNIMAGYLLHDQPGELQALEDGWYDTGDIIDIDEDGYLYIQGRVKRFAKVAGEMISLLSVEELASQCWPEAMHVALAIADTGKGERIILLSTLKDADRKVLVHYAHEHGFDDFQVPRKIVYVDAIPLLGTGKVHYPAAQALLESMMEKTK